MPARSKGPRLWWRKPRRSKRTGKITHPGVWIIRDGKRQTSTGCGHNDLDGAARKLAEYIARKHVVTTTKGGPRDPAEIPVADVIALYAKNVVPGHARPKETAQRLARVLTFFGGDMLVSINGDRCRAYVKSRSTDAAARKELEDLRAAINHHRKEGHCEKLISIVLPARRVNREQWLTRQEVAKMVFAAWQYREIQKGTRTDRRSRQHVAKFILVGCYTGTRAGSICAAALQPTPGHGWIDTERGVFYRRPRGRRETKKRQPAIPLPAKLMAHIRRWKRRGQRFCVEWNREQVRDVDKAFRRNASEAGVKATPHTLRHTAATWLMQEGADPWQAAEYLGMTLKTLLDNYGHHHPEHLRGPRNVFDRPPQQRHNIQSTDQEQTSSNVVKISGKH
jgi:integrase